MNRYNYGRPDAQLYGFSPLRGIEGDLTALFSLIPGGGAATQKFNEFKKLIQDEATKGAKAAIPDIKAEVEATVKPLVIAAMLASAGALLVGIAAFLRSSHHS